MVAKNKPMERYISDCVRAQGLKALLAFLLLLCVELDAGGAEVESIVKLDDGLRVCKRM